MLCTRCQHFEAVPDGVLCTQCAAPSGFQAPPVGAPKVWLRSPVGLGWAAVALLGLAAAVDLYALGADFYTYRVTGDVLDGNLGDDQADFADALTTVASAAQALVLVACAVVFVIWFWRVRVNAEVFAPDGHRKARGWVIAGWAVPIVSLWYPRRIMVDIWDASSPGDRPASHALINVWWTLWLVTNTLGRLLYTSFDEADSSREIHDAMTQVMIADALDLVAAVFAAAVVLRLTRMQDQKAHQGPPVPAAL